MYYMYLNYMYVIIILYMMQSNKKVGQHKSCFGVNLFNSRRDIQLVLVVYMFDYYIMMICRGNSEPIEDRIASIRQALLKQMRILTHQTEICISQVQLLIPNIQFCRVSVNVITGMFSWSVIYNCSCLDLKAVRFFAS